jgi:tryptophan-rich sensory protein
MEKDARRSSWAVLLGFVVLCQAAAGAGALAMATAPSEDAWYRSLVKPAWNPPSWVFAPVWTTLYALMGVAAYLAWRRWPSAGARLALALFAVQLLANVAWSWIFFRWHELGFATLEIGALWALILAWLIASARVSRAAAGLIVPYLLWVSFAAVLTTWIWRANA